MAIRMLHVLVAGLTLLASVSWVSCRPSLPEADVPAGSRDLKTSLAIGAFLDKLFAGALPDLAGQGLPAPPDSALSTPVLPPLPSLPSLPSLTGFPALPDPNSPASDLNAEARIQEFDQMLKTVQTLVDTLLPNPSNSPSSTN